VGAVTVALAIVGYGAYSIATGTDSQMPPLRSLGEGTIEVLEATYGKSCRPQFDIATGNATSAVAGACNGFGACAYTIDVAVLGDPANGCGKDFEVRWRCGREATPQSAHVAAEAHQNSLLMACDE
jgi:hypothetical protein